MSTLALIVLFSTATNVLQISHQSGESAPDAAAYTAAVYGADAELANVNAGALSYSNGAAVLGGRALQRGPDLEPVAGWPLLLAHPWPLPEGGYAYRLREGSNVTWWVARDADKIATQISAHNAAGDDIRRSINLRTGQETIINETLRDRANTFAEFRSARQVMTNQAVRARGDRQP